MEDLYGWVKNLTGYFLFLAVAENLIAGKKYVKYFHLFAGMVTILLVLQPLAGSMQLEERIARFYEMLVFRYQAEDLQADLLQMEKERLSQMIAHYEEAVAEDLRQMAGEWGIMVRECQVEIGEEAGSEQFGAIVRIRMAVSMKGEEDPYGNSEARADRRNEQKTVEAVEPVVIGEEDRTKTEAAPERTAEYSVIERLRRKIASYYDLEEAYVEIQVVEG